MEISGRFLQAFELKSGTSKAGNGWKSQDFLIETDEKYPKKIVFTVFSHVDMIEGVKAGDIVDVNFEIESREWNGKWFTQAKAIGVNKVELKPIDNRMKFDNGDTVNTKEMDVSGLIPKETKNTAWASAPDDEENDLPF